MKANKSTIQVNINRLVENIKSSNVYSPIIEAIVNSIEAIESADNKNGNVIITFERDKQSVLDVSDEKVFPPVIKVTIEDNGIGFNNDNINSFNTIYSDYKLKTGGKGFGRFTYLKFFQNVKIESIYKEEKDFFYREFEFVKDEHIIENEKKGKTDIQKIGTKIVLKNIKKEYKYALNKKLETIARKILEELLVYFVIDGYTCPKIILKESDSDESIILNDYLDKKNEIIEMDNQVFTLSNNDKTEIFKIKIFKVYYCKTRSSVNLVADKRQVTNEMLHSYIPEFKDDFFDYIEGQKKEKIKRNYSIKSYVMGQYLDENVSVERNEFNFSKEKDLFYPFSQKDIEKQSAEITKNIFSGEVLTRQKDKEKRIRNYVDNVSPWYKSYINELDFSSLPFDIKDEEIEIELQKIRLKTEREAKAKIKIILQKDKIDKKEKVEKLISEITEASKSDLLHYVATRKVVLELFKKSLQIKEGGEYELEEVIHNIIFPIKKDNTSTSYDDHNLWMIDERLSFNEFLSSDKPLGNGSKDRPDIVIFDKAVSVREGDEASNPITVFEFKRPQRNGYDDMKDDPIDQIGKYIEQIRNGKYTTPKGRQIIANEKTPAYGFLICDFTPKIINICEKTHDLSKSADNQSYFGFKKNYNFYIEVMSFDKLLKDAELRNKIFFKKLNIS